MKAYLALFLVLLALAGCADTDTVMLERGSTYPPTKYVQILFEPAKRTFKEIALLETRGGANTSITDLLENMKMKAAVIGADAVIPTENAKTQVPPIIIEDPVLGYQSIGGKGTLRVIRGIAIKYTD